MIVYIQYTEVERYSSTFNAFFNLDFTADRLFQFIANETNTKKSSSTYGLTPSATNKSTTHPVNIERKKDK